MSDTKTTALTNYTNPDPAVDVIPIADVANSTTKKITRNNLLGITSTPVGINDTQVLTAKTLTAPAINSPVLGGTITGTYTLAGTPTFPSSVVTLTGSQTLTNKILTSPTINAPTLTNASITQDAVTGFSSANTGTLYGISVTSSVITSAAVGSSSFVTGVKVVDKMQNPYKFSVYRNAALNSGSSGFALITFDTVLYDTSSNYSVSTGKFTAPIAGFYHFNAAFSLLSADTQTGILAFYKNGTEYIRGSQIPAGGTATMSVIGSVDVQLAANDFIQIYNFYGTTAVALNVGNAPIQTYFQGFLISAT